jgi:hypothetical protein
MLHTMLAAVLPTQLQVLSHAPAHDEHIWVTHACPSVWLSLQHEHTARYRWYCRPLVGASTQHHATHQIEVHEVQSQLADAGVHLVELDTAGGCVTRQGRERWADEVGRVVDDIGTTSGSDCGSKWLKSTFSQVSLYLMSSITLQDSCVDFSAGRNITLLQYNMLCSDACFRNTELV